MADKDNVMCIYYCNASSKLAANGLRWTEEKMINKFCIIVTRLNFFLFYQSNSPYQLMPHIIALVHLSWLSEAKCNEIDYKWFLEFRP